MPPCKLCGTDATLRKSHIYPEHLYHQVRNDGQQFHAYTNEGQRRTRQHGIWENLFCDDCEQLLSREYEGPFARFWLDNNALPPSMTTDEMELVNIDYLKFKLYHLSILFRASISTLSHFNHVALGPHEETIRNMLLEQTDNDKYHISAAVLVKEDNSVVDGIITFPKYVPFKGHSFYQTLYSGCAWIIKVSSHTLPGLSETGLQENGTMVVTRERYEEYQELQEIASLLRSYESN